MKFDLEENQSSKKVNAEAKKITVGILESDLSQKKEIISLLDSLPNISCVWKAASAVEALIKLSDSPVDVILTDICLPDMNGIDFIRIAKSNYAFTEIVVVTGYQDPDTVFQAFTAGAAGYLLKASSPEILQAAIHTVLSGGALLTANVARLIAQSFQKKELMPARPLPLTRREGQVFTLLAEGLRYKQIASELNISIETVKTHVKKICLKLKVANRLAAVAKFGSGSANLASHSTKRKNGREPDRMLSRVLE